MTIVVVGAGSMIGRALRSVSGSDDWLFLSGREALADRRWLRGAECVLNLAYHPGLRHGAYDECLDIDWQLAHLLAEGSAAYVMASSRMVYGGAKSRALNEDMVPSPDTAYGRAKLETEQRLQRIIGDRLTILRLSNVFAPGEAYGERRSFFGQALRSLRDKGFITFDIAPFVKRDFISSAALSGRLARVLQAPVPGIFNIAAGVAVPCGQVAEWLIEGFGSGELRVTDIRDHDAFSMDIERATSAWGFEPYLPAALRADCLECGRLLLMRGAADPYAVRSACTAGEPCEMSSPIREAS